MTKLERLFLLKVLNETLHPSARGSEYNWDEKGRFVATHHNEAHLLDSADYKLGWQRCRERVEGYIKWMLKGVSTEDMRKFIGGFGRVKNLTPMDNEQLDMELAKYGMEPSKYPTRESKITAILETYKEFPK